MPRTRKRRKPVAKPARAAMVTHHLEKISRKGLDRYSEVVLDFLKGQNGVYALYGLDGLHYVGVAEDLKGMLGVHMKDAKWASLSLFLIAGAFDTRDLETLLLKIFTPPGNRKPGGLAGSRDLRPDFMKLVSEAQKDELASIFEDAGQRPVPVKAAEAVAAKVEAPAEAPVEATEGRREKNALAPYSKKKGFEMRFWYKGMLVKAFVERGGLIKYEGRTYSSPSQAASEIMGRTTNGWTVWKYERTPGEWVLLDELRKKRPARAAPPKP